MSALFSIADPAIKTKAQIYLNCAPEDLETLKNAISQDDLQGVTELIVKRHPTPKHTPRNTPRNTPKNSPRHSPGHGDKPLSVFQTNLDVMDSGQYNGRYDMTEESVDVKRLSHNTSYKKACQENGFEDSGIVTLEKSDSLDSSGSKRFETFLMTGDMIIRTSKPGKLKKSELSRKMSPDRRSLDSPERKLTDSPERRGRDSPSSRATPSPDRLSEDSSSEHRQSPLHKSKIPQPVSKVNLVPIVPQVPDGIESPENYDEFHNGTKSPPIPAAPVLPPSGSYTDNEIMSKSSDTESWPPPPPPLDEQEKAEAYLDLHSSRPEDLPPPQLEAGSQRARQELLQRKWVDNVPSDSFTSQESTAQSSETYDSATDKTEENRISVDSGIDTSQQTSQRNIVISKSAEKISYSNNAQMRSSKSHENYLESTDLTMVNIDFEDNVAASLDALHYTEQSMTSLEYIPSSSSSVQQQQQQSQQHHQQQSPQQHQQQHPHLHQHVSPASRSLHSSPEKRTDRNERMIMPGFIQLEEARSISKLKEGGKVREGAQRSFSLEERGTGPIVEYEDGPYTAAADSDNVMFGAPLQLRPQEEIDNFESSDLTVDGVSEPLSEPIPIPIATKNTAELVQSILNSKIGADEPNGDTLSDLQHSNNNGGDNNGGSVSPDNGSDISDAESIYHQPTKAVDRPSAQRLANRLYEQDGFKKSDISRHLSKK